MTMLAIGILVAGALEGVMERRLRKMSRWRLQVEIGGIDLELMGG